MDQDPVGGDHPARGGVGLSDPGAALRELARLHGLQLSHTGVDDRRRRASTDALVGTLRALGAPIDHPDDAPGALRAVRAERDARPCEPVHVAWEGKGVVPLRGTDGPVDCELALEDGATRGWTSPDPDVRLTGVPFGVHRLRCGDVATTVISAPRTAPTPSGRTWGVFVPLYALRTERDPGCGDLTDLETLIGWTSDRGGQVAATLPLLATFHGAGSEPEDPSPYSPVSRVFWNELHLDPERAPELEHSAAARRILDSSAHRREVAELRGADLVDHARVAELKRPVLEALAETCSQGPRGSDLERFVSEHPEVASYARFRARVEGGGPAAERYHTYVQWLFEEQLTHVGDRARSAGGGLYFDLPLGVHPDGYDVWRWPDAFASGAAGGAPPDAFFSEGQNWGFPPLHPEAVRSDGYAYHRACLRHLLRHASTLRIDHVMGLHRLWWIPDGLEAADGVYVRYRAEELYALLTLEAHRAGATIVGEDLGTVPAPVRAAMRRHGLLRSYVLEFEMGAGEPAIAPAPRSSLASPDTHDLPPFAAFWTGEDTRLRTELGLMSTEDAASARAERAELRRSVVRHLEREGRLSPTDGGDHPTEDVLGACLAEMADGDAAIVVVPLEDLWGETHPQNVPGTTGDRYPNWRRRARHSLEDATRLDGVTDRLEPIDRRA